MTVMDPRPHPVRHARACSLPIESVLRAHLPRIDHVDSFELGACDPDASMVEIYAGVLGHIPSWFRHLLVLRSLIVRPLGTSGVRYRDLEASIDTTRRYATGDKIGRWTLMAQQPHELIAGANDKHLDFRVSVLREQQDGDTRVVLSTGVMTHNAFGRAYLATILPFHRYGVRTLLTEAARAGRV